MREHNDGVTGDMRPVVSLEFHEGVSVLFCIAISHLVTKIKSVRVVACTRDTPQATGHRPQATHTLVTRKAYAAKFP